jgi:hypothetical protein
LGGVVVVMCSTTIFFTSPDNTESEVVVGHVTLKGLTDERASTAGCSREAGSTAYKVKIGGFS